MSNREKEVVLITGANRGIGLALVKQFLDMDYKVIATCREPDKADHLQALSANIPNLSILPLKVDDKASIRALTSSLEGQSIDILVNNAGVLSGFNPKMNAMTVENDPSQTLGSIDPEAWEHVLRINTIAPIMVMQALLPQLRNSKTRKIAMISSSWGSITKMAEGVPLAYGSSKAALNAATKILASTLQNERFVVVTLNPGWVRTDMGSQEASLEPQESARNLAKIIETLKPEQTGQFISHTGEIIPW